MNDQLLYVLGGIVVVVGCAAAILSLLQRSLQRNERGIASQEGLAWYVAAAILAVSSAGSFVFELNVAGGVFLVAATAAINFADGRTRK